MRTALLGAALGALVTGVLAASPARAQPAPADVSRAVSLFDEAKKRLAAGSVDEACKLFVDSYRIDPQVGTLLNTALCHERAGKTASAWAEFTSVVSLANRAGQPKRAEFARDHARLLEPKLSRVLFEVRDTSSGLALTIDGEPLAVDAARSGPVPVDPGAHVVAAMAPGKKAWRSTLVVAAGRGTASLEVPSLVDAPPAPEPGPSRAAAPLAAAPELLPSPSPSPSPLRPVAWGVAAGGVVALVVGGVGGSIALSAQSDADRDCSNGACRSSAGLDANERAHTWATVSTVGFVAAGVLAVTAVVLFVTSSDSSRRAASGRVLPGGFTF